MTRLSAGWLRFLFVFFILITPVIAGEVTVMVYNVQNYLPMDRRVEGKSLKNAPKPEQEVAALVRAIAEVKPDILGLCEMGGRDQVADLQSRLKAAGVDLPEVEWIQGMDSQRHVALLSRLPITTRNSVGEVPITINGRPNGVQRGFLDATVNVAEGADLRLLGVHFKSRRIVPEYDQAELRMLEARELRKYVDSILEKNPEVKLLVFGDFNDTKNLPPIKEVWGKKGSPLALHMVDLRDSRGETWTHFWKVADEYSRIDYLFASAALRPWIDREKSRIPDSPNLMDASDHRPLVLKLQTPE